MWSIWDKTSVTLAMVQIHENTVHPHTPWFTATRRNNGYLQADEAYTQHQNYFGQCNWLKVSTLVQKFVGTEATTLYSSSKWSFLSTEAEMMSYSVLHCQTHMVPKVFLPEALKQQGRQSNHRTCLSQTVKLPIYSPRPLYDIVILPCAQTEQ